MECRCAARFIPTRCLTLAAALLLLAAHAEGANKPPAVTLTSPASGAIYTAPATITMVAQASDPDAGGSVKSVTFYAENAVIGVATTPPYSVVWKNAPQGTYSMTAVATDNTGATTRSTRSTISVMSMATATRSNTPPLVGVTGPASGTLYTAPAKIVLLAEALDNNGAITKVDFYAGATLVGSSTTAPYSLTMNNVVAGTYSVTAVATDNSGLTARSSAVILTVTVPVTIPVTLPKLPAVNVAPIVSLASPVNGGHFTAPATLTLSAIAADADGTVARVDFYDGTTPIASLTAPPFAISWFGVQAGTYALTVVATDNRGATTRSAAATVTVTAGSASGPNLGEYLFGRGWATFGIALPQGAATAVKIASLPTQTDVKTTWPDGSIRFAIVTAKIDLPGVYAITSAAVTVGTFTPTWPTASVSFSTGGQTYTATLPTFRSGDSWLSSGSLVREARVLVTPAAGTLHPLLQVIFDVRSYTGGGHRVDVTVQNVQDIPAGAPVTYDVSVKVNGSTVYSKAAVTQPYMTRWRKVFTTGGLVEAPLAPDFASFYAAKALPQFLSTVADPVPVATGAQFAPLGFGDMSADMTVTGGRPEIAPYPNWVAQYLVHKRLEQRAYMLAAADLSGSWAGHITEPDGATLISLDTYPNYWLDGRAPTHPDGPNAARVTASGTPWPGGFSQWLETAHLPSLTYVPYLLTGDRFYLDQMKFWANFALLKTYPGTGERQAAKGILMENQPRGFGWGLRTIADLAAYIPDADPMRAYFRSKLQNNLDFLDTYARTNNGGPFEFVFVGKWANSATGGEYTSLWQASYVGWALDRAAQHGFGPVAAMRDRIARVQVRFFNSEAQGWPRIAGAPYYPVVGTKTAGFFTTMKQIFDASWADDPRTQPFAGYYGPEARLMLRIGVAQGIAGSQGALDYLNPFILGDLNYRSGWAIGAVP